MLPSKHYMYMLIISLLVMMVPMLFCPLQLAVGFRPGSCLLVGQIVLVTANRRLNAWIYLAARLAYQIVLLVAMLRQFNLAMHR